LEENGQTSPFELLQFWLGLKKEQSRVEI
jgi:hypothetical protein